MWIHSNSRNHVFASCIGGTRWTNNDRTKPTIVWTTTGELMASIKIENAHLIKKEWSVWVLTYFFFLLKAELLPTPPPIKGYGVPLLDFFSWWLILWWCFALMKSISCLSSTPPPGVEEAALSERLWWGGIYAPILKCYYYEDDEAEADCPTWLI